MSRPRGGTALFDLLEEGTAGPAGPAAGASTPAAKGSSGSAPTPVAGDELPVVLGTASRRGAGQHGGGASGGDTGQPLVEVDDDCVRVSLTSVRTAIIVFVLIALVAGAFEIGQTRGHKTGFARGFEAGRASYAADTLTEIEAARLKPPSPDIASGLLAGAPATALQAYDEATGRDSSKDADGASWVPGHTYIVAQGFSSGRESDARAAQAFLASRGIETTLVRFDSGAMQLITREGFNRTDAAQRALADRLLEQTHDAGTDYFASGGGYKLDGYFATFTGDRW